MKPKYQVGDRVKIKDELIHVNSEHPAWKHAGTVMTVRKVQKWPDYDLMWYDMEEDKEEDGGWEWFDEYIDGFAEDFEDPDPFDDSTFPEITFEQLLASTTLPERRTV